MEDDYTAAQESRKQSVKGCEFKIPFLLDLGFSVRNTVVNMFQSKPYIWNSPVRRNRETWDI